MAFDTAYRPRVYQDVLGQEATTAVLKQFVKEGRGFHQSYVFCGQYGSGKTTTARILVRALLCAAPVEGEACDECHSCKVLLSGGVHESFEELDAASKSGKGDLARIIEDVSYSTFSGKRRVYIFDEAHRLSKSALDVLLKPMEDCVSGAEDKKLICIFCTTDPGKMSTTVFSRCAPAFVIRVVEPEVIAKRCAHVCEQEDLEFEPEALLTIAEVTSSHIRDALKTVEGVSMLGAVNMANVSQYLQIGANDLALTVLESLGSNLPLAVETAVEMAKDISPSAAYERLAEASLCAYRAHLGVGKIPSQWNKARISALSERGPELLGLSARFAAPPHRPNRNTLLLDVGTTHYAVVSKTPPGQVASIVLAVSAAPQEQISEPKAPEVLMNPPKKSEGVGTVPTNASTAPRDEGGVWIDPKGIGKGPLATRGEATASSETHLENTLAPSVFRDLFRFHLRELSGGRKGQSG